MSSPAFDLSQFDDEYRRQLDNPANRFDEIPDGVYHVVVENVELTEAKSSGRPMMKWTLRVKGPSSANRVLWKRRVITDKTLPYISEELAICRLQLSAFSELEANLTKLIDVHLEVRKHTKDGRYDIYLLHRLEVPFKEGDLKPKMARNPYSDDDDIPF